MTGTDLISEQGHDKFAWLEDVKNVGDEVMIGILKSKHRSHQTVYNDQL